MVCVVYIVLFSLVQQTVEHQVLCSIIKFMMGMGYSEYSSLHPQLLRQGQSRMSCALDFKKNSSCCTRPILKYLPLAPDTGRFSLLIL